MPAVLTPPSRLLACPCLALALTVVALVGCSSTAPEPDGALPSLTAPSQPAVADGVSQAGVPQLINFTVTDGQVTGPGATVAVPLGTPVQLTVLADTTDVLLVSGYDLRAQVTVENPVQVVFTADRASGFDVVLEGSGVVLTRLEVG